MKKILITGKNSYIGKALKERLSNVENHYQVDMISLREELWKQYNFGEYDTVVHTAAIVHKRNIDTTEYEKINVDLALDVAEKAKEQGVKQFIFLSTMGIYNQSIKNITEDTEPSPATLYAKSKLKAEKLVEKEQTSYFNVAIIRPPLVYGPKAPGNYQKLSTLSKRLPIFPKVNNKRSMIYITNLSEFIRLIIENNYKGTFYPQNKEFVNTSHLFGVISQIYNKKSLLIPGLNLPLKVLGNKVTLIQKVFGDFTYCKKLPGGHLNSDFKGLLGYDVVDFKDSIRLTEGGLYDKRR